MTAAADDEEEAAAAATSTSRASHVTGRVRPRFGSTDSAVSAVSVVSNRSAEELQFPDSVSGQEEVNQYRVGSSSDRRGLFDSQVSSQATDNGDEGPYYVPFDYIESNRFGLGTRREEDEDEICGRGAYSSGEEDDDEDSDFVGQNDRLLSSYVFLSPHWLKDCMRGLLDEDVHQKIADIRWTAFREWFAPFLV